MSKAKNTTIEEAAERAIIIFPEFLRKIFNSDIECSMNITIAQKRILHQVFFKPNLTMSELSNLLNLEMSSVTVQVDSLVKLKILERNKDANDRRIVRIGLTAKGQQLMQELRTQLKNSFTKLFSDLSAEQLATVRHSLEQLYKIFAEVQH